MNESNTDLTNRYFRSSSWILGAISKTHLSSVYFSVTQDTAFNNSGCNLISFSPVTASSSVHMDKDSLFFLSSLNYFLTRHIRSTLQLYFSVSILIVVLFFFNSSAKL